MKKRFWFATILALIFVFSTLIACNFGNNSGNNSSNGNGSGGSSTSSSDTSGSSGGSSDSSDSGSSDSGSGSSGEEKPPKPYTDEENALYWIDGRDGTMRYTGAYRVDIIENSNDNGDKYRIETTESWDRAMRYFFVYNTYSYPDETTVERDFLKEALKADNGDGYARGIFLKEETEDNKETGKKEVVKTAFYVSPQFINDKTAKYLPVSFLQDYGIENGKDLKTLIAGINAFYEGTDAETTFTRNDDGSVTLSIEFMVTETETDTDLETGEEVTKATTDISSSSFTVKDGKIVKVEDFFVTAEVYSDDTPDYTAEYSRSARFFYEFNDLTYNTIDFSSLTPENAYHSDIQLHFVGDFGTYNYGEIYNFNYREYLAGDTITEENIFNSFLGSYGTEISGSYDNTPIFEVYTNESMTERLTSLRLTEPSYDLYAKFIAPAENKALVLTMTGAVRSDGTIDAYLYNPTNCGIIVCNLNDRFYPHEAISNHIILKVNGADVGDYSSFVCSESKVYTVLYDKVAYGTDVKVDHAALTEWEYDVSRHWHKCTECSREKYNEAVHEEITKNGQVVCKICGYVIHAYTEQENFDYWSGALSSSMAFVNNGVETYTYSYDITYFDHETKKASSKALLTEARGTDNKFYKVTERLSSAGSDGALSLLFKQTNALKAATLNGNAAKLEITINEQAEGKSSIGRYRNESYGARDMAEHLPENWFSMFCIDKIPHGTIEIFKEAFTSAYNEMYAQQNCEVYGISFKRNDDGSVSFFYSAKGEYVQSTTAAGDTKTSYECLYEIVALDGYIVKTIEKSVHTTVFPDDTPTDVSDYVYEQNFGYRVFDDDFYNSIPTETDEVYEEN